MPHQITLIPGDGIGPEVADATLKLLDASGVAVEWSHADAGMVAVEKHGVALPDETVEMVRKSGTALKGPTTTPVGGGHVSANVQLRKRLDLYASIRPIKTVPGIKSRYSGVDFVVFRENTEGLYAGVENVVSQGVVLSIKVVTEKASRRIARSAFEYAKRHGRKRVTAVHKANIMKLGDGFFLECCQDIAKEYPEIGYDEHIVDAMCMKLVSDPSPFDILLMENLYGDIVSDLGAGLVGGLGMVPGANIGEECAVFEAVHGSAPDIAGKGVANPTALMKSSILMLQHLGEVSAAERIEKSLCNVLSEGKYTTRDVGGNSDTADFTQAVIDGL